jgi:tetratricopeptide (TPR) repeat protein
VACSRVRQDVPASPSAGTSLAPVAAAPRSLRELPTTSGPVALDNLDAEINGYRKAVAKAPSLDRMVTLAADLDARGQYLGKIADYEEAARVADAAVQNFGQAGHAYAARAKARAVYHRFAEALSDLDRAQALGMKDRELRETRASIFQALGRYADALAIRRVVSTERPQLSTLGNQAALLAEMGDVDGAERLFVAAQDLYRDVSPFPVAWLWQQQGQMWEKRGQLARARTLYQAAIERVPGYAHAVSHLAGLSPPTRAIELLRGILPTSDDPEYRAQLAVLLRENAQPEEATLLVAAARLAFDGLTQLHPEAFADHAARFWLGAGQDPQKALAWARLSVDLRPKPEALSLLVDAALAAHDSGTACAAAARALTAGPGSSATHLLAARAFDVCARPDQASRERELASSAP